MGSQRRHSCATYAILLNHPKVLFIEQQERRKNRIHPASFSFSLTSKPAKFIKRSVLCTKRTDSTMLESQRISRRTYRTVKFRRKSKIAE